MITIGSWAWGRMKIVEPLHLFLGKKRKSHTVRKGHPEHKVASGACGGKCMSMTW